MTITVNDKQLSLPTEVTTIKEFADWKGIPSQGTAIAVNGKLIKADIWAVTPLTEFDNMLVISAAYGG